MPFIQEIFRIYLKLLNIHHVEAKNIVSVVYKLIPFREPSEIRFDSYIIPVARVSGLIQC
jgi:hypothetical protein